MQYIIGIDPGNIESAYVLVDAVTLRPIAFTKQANELMYCHMVDAIRALELDSYQDLHIAIEMIASYGMPVGAEVFETCVWIGHLEDRLKDFPTSRIFRKDEKLAICGSPRANDANITQALVDRFAPGQPNHGKGTKKNPGFFYGFRKDIWQVFSCADHCLRSRHP